MLTLGVYRIIWVGNSQVDPMEDTGRSGMPEFTLDKLCNSQVDPMEDTGSIDEYFVLIGNTGSNSQVDPMEDTRSDGVAVLVPVEVV